MRHTAVPKEAVLGVFEEFIEEESSSLVLLDGFPRYPDRLDGFRSSNKKISAKILAICRIEVDDSVVYERVKGREQRFRGVEEDDDFVKNRLSDYRDNVLPTLDILANDHPEYVLDGALPLEDNIQRLQEIYRTESGLSQVQ